MIVYPKVLPPPQKDGYGIKPTSGVLKTQMTSGIARQRKITEKPPTAIKVVWVFTKYEFAIFEAWYLHEAEMGAVWFEIDLIAGLGFVKHTARFTDDTYDSDLDPKTNKFTVSAKLETQVRPVLSKGALALTLIYGIEDLQSAAKTLKECVHNAFKTI